MELRNKPWLDQPSEHHKVVITVLIHTWNEHKDIQVNKHKARTLVCSTLNQCIIHKVYASRNNPTRAQE